MRRTKILATAGPSCRDQDTLAAMMEAGLDAVRLNFSHGTHGEHRATAAAVRAASEETQRPVPIMQDLQGTKIRLGRLADGAVSLHRGDIVRVDSDPSPGNAKRFSVDEPAVIAAARKDMPVLLGDGEVCLRIQSYDAEGFDAHVEAGGVVRQGAGITAPGMDLPGGLTEKDRADLVVGVDLGCEYVALSFVRHPDEVAAARAILDDMGAQPRLIAKVERLEALERLPELIKVSDGILVARGDLGLALAPEQVPIAQKRMLHACAHAGRLGITATQMLESMISSPRPTRAEASDVANAILDGTQVVMLSGETAMGNHPIAAVQMMDRIALEAERAVYSGELDVGVHRGESEGSVADAIALACAVTAEDLQARAIIAFTRTGMTAHRVSKHRPAVPILAATPDPLVQRRLNLVWGVTPILVPEAESLDAMIATAEASALARDLVASGDVIVLTGGDVGVPGSTNLMRVSQVT